MSERSTYKRNFPKLHSHPPCPFHLTSASHCLYLTPPSSPLAPYCSQCIPPSHSFPYPPPQFSTSLFDFVPPRIFPLFYPTAYPYSTTYPIPSLPSSAAYSCLLSPSPLSFLTSLPSPPFPTPGRALGRVEIMNHNSWPFCLARGHFPAW